MYFSLAFVLHVNQVEKIPAVHVFVLLLLYAFAYGLTQSWRILLARFSSTVQKVHMSMPWHAAVFVAALLIEGRCEKRTVCKEARGFQNQALSKVIS